MVGRSPTCLHRCAVPCRDAGCHGGSPRAACGWDRASPDSSSPVVALGSASAPPLQACPPQETQSGRSGTCAVASPDTASQVVASAGPAGCVQQGALQAPGHPGHQSCRRTAHGAGVLGSVALASLRCRVQARCRPEPPWTLRRGPPAWAPASVCTKLRTGCSGRGLGAVVLAVRFASGGQTGATLLGRAFRMARGLTEPSRLRLVSGGQRPREALVRWVSERAPDRQPAGSQAHST